MTVNEVLRRVQNMVGDEAGSFVKVGQIIDLINDACIDLNIETKVVYTTDDFSTAAGVATYALPSTFISIKRVSIPNFGLLRPVSRNAVNMYDPVGSSGHPGWYSVEGPQLILYPTPDAVYTVEHEFVCTPSTVTAGGDTVPLPTYLHPLVAKLCYAALKERDEDYEAANSIKAAALAEAAQRTATANNAQEESYPVIRDVDSVYE